MNSSGLTSITFRNLECQEIIELVKSSHLDGIEWGSDIHVPSGDIERAKAVRDETIAAGLKVLSYGSYFRVGDTDDAKKEFMPFLKSAIQLDAPIIRVWAGSKSSSSCDAEYFAKVVDDTKTICNMAKEHHITICFEYHRGTLTDTCDSALRLIGKADCANLKTYWQPNPDISHQENEEELSNILPFVEYIHVFNWSVGNERHDLESGTKEWLDYMKIIKTDGKSHSFLLEFVKDDSSEQFSKDAHTLLKILNNEAD